MSNRKKAVLLSALVYPGAGHFILKKYAVCVALVVAFSVPLVLVINEIMTKTRQIAEQISNGEITSDLTAITEAVLNLTSGNEALSINISIMTIVWVISILDAYRVGKSKI